MVSVNEQSTKSLSKAIGKYCKTYQLQDLASFEKWPETVGTLKNQSSELPPQLTPETVVYLQENYVVTQSIFKERDIIFDQVTPAWKTFCQEVLDFQIPNL